MYIYKNTEKAEPEGAETEENEGQEWERWIKPERERERKRERERETGSIRTCKQPA